MDAMYSDFNPAYEEFSSLTAGSSCRFYPGVLPYCSHCDRAGLPLSLDNYRALVHTLRRQGADGISIYNYQMHWDGFRSTGRDNGSETMYPTALAHLRELTDLERVARGPRHYLFRSMWGGFQGYRPAGTTCNGGRRDPGILLQRGTEEACGSYPFRLYEDIAAAGHARLHFRVAGLAPADPLAVALNDTPITAPRPAPHLAPGGARRLTRPSAGRLYELHVRPGARLDGRRRQSAYGHLAGRLAGRVADRRGGGDGNPGLTGSAVH